MDSDVTQTTSNAGILTSTVADDEGAAPAPSGDSQPSSSSDANSVDVTARKKPSEDPISSTSDVYAKMSDTRRRMNKAELDTEIHLFADECNLGQLPTEKITENVEDIVSDLESLLGGPTDHYPVAAGRQAGVPTTLDGGFFNVEAAAVDAAKRESQNVSPDTNEPIGSSLDAKAESVPETSDALDSSTVENVTAVVEDAPVAMDVDEKNEIDSPMDVDEAAIDTKTTSVESSRDEVDKAPTQTSETEIKLNNIEEAAQKMDEVKIIDEIKQVKAEISSNASINHPEQIPQLSEKQEITQSVDVDEPTSAIDKVESSQTEQSREDVKITLPKQTPHEKEDVIEESDYKSHEVVTATSEVQSISENAKNEPIAYIPNEQAASEEKPEAERATETVEITTTHIFKEDDIVGDSTETEKASDNVTKEDKIVEDTPESKQAGDNIAKEDEDSTEIKKASETDKEDEVVEKSPAAEEIAHAEQHEESKPDDKKDSSGDGLPAIVETSLEKSEEMSVDEEETKQSTTQNLDTTTKPPISTEITREEETSAVTQEATLQDAETSALDEKTTSPAAEAEVLVEQDATPALHEAKKSALNEKELNETETLASDKVETQPALNKTETPALDEIETSPAIDKVETSPAFTEVETSTTLNKAEPSAEEETSATLPEAEISEEMNEAVISQPNEQPIIQDDKEKAILDEPMDTRESDSEVDEPPKEIVKEIPEDVKIVAEPNALEGDTEIKADVEEIPISDENTEAMETETCESEEIMESSNAEKPIEAAKSEDSCETPKIDDVAIETEIIDIVKPIETAKHEESCDKTKIDAVEIESCSSEKPAKEESCETPKIESTEPEKPTEAIETAKLEEICDTPKIESSDVEEPTKTIETAEPEEIIENTEREVETIAPAEIEKETIDSISESSEDSGPSTEEKPSSVTTESPEEKKESVIEQQQSDETIKEDTIADEKPAQLEINEAAMETDEAEEKVDTTEVVHESPTENKDSIVEPEIGQKQADVKDEEAIKCKEIQALESETADAIETVPDTKDDKEIPSPSDDSTPAEVESTLEEIQTKTPVNEEEEMDQMSPLELKEDSSDESVTPDNELNKPDEQAKPPEEVAKEGKIEIITEVDEMETDQESKVEEGKVEIALHSASKEQEDDEMEVMSPLELQDDANIEEQSTEDKTKRGESGNTSAESSEMSTEVAAKDDKIEEQVQQSESTIEEAKNTPKMEIVEDKGESLKTPVEIVEDTEIAAKAEENEIMTTEQTEATDVKGGQDIEDNAEIIDVPGKIEGEKSVITPGKDVEEIASIKAPETTEVISKVEAEIMDVSPGKDAEIPEEQTEVIPEKHTETPDVLLEKVAGTSEVIPAKEIETTKNATEAVDVILRKDSETADLIKEKDTETTDVTETEDVSVKESLSTDKNEEVIPTKSKDLAEVIPEKVAEEITTAKEAEATEVIPEKEAQPITEENEDVEMTEAVPEKVEEAKTADIECVKDAEIKSKENEASTPMQDVEDSPESTSGDVKATEIEVPTQNKDTIESSREIKETVEVKVAGKAIETPVEKKNALAEENTTTKEHQTSEKITLPDVEEIDVSTSEKVEKQSAKDETTVLNEVVETSKIVEVTSNDVESKLESETKIICAPSKVDVLAKETQPTPVVTDDGKEKKQAEIKTNEPEKKTDDPESKQREAKTKGLKSKLPETKTKSLKSKQPEAKSKGLESKLPETKTKSLKSKLPETITNAAESKQVEAQTKDPERKIPEPKTKDAESKQPLTKIHDADSKQLEIKTTLSESKPLIEPEINQSVSVEKADVTIVPVEVNSVLKAAKKIEDAPVKIDSATKQSVSDEGTKISAVKNVEVKAAMTEIVKPVSEVKSTEIKTEDSTQIKSTVAEKSKDTKKVSAVEIKLPEKSEDSMELKVGEIIAVEEKSPAAEKSEDTTRVKKPVAETPEDSTKSTASFVEEKSPVVEKVESTEEKLKTDKTIKKKSVPKEIPAVQVESIEKSETEAAQKVSPEKLIEVPASKVSPEKAIEAPVSKVSAEEAAEVPVSEVSPKEAIEVPDSKVSSEEAIEVPVSKVSPKEAIEVPVSEVSAKEAIEVPVSEISAKEAIEVPVSKVSAEEAIEVPVSKVRLKEAIEVPVSKVSSKEAIEVPVSKVSAEEAIEVPVSKVSAEEAIEVPVSKVSAEEAAEIPVSKVGPKEAIEAPVDVPNETNAVNDEPQVSEVEVAKTKPVKQKPSPAKPLYSLEESIAKTRTSREKSKYARKDSTEVKKLVEEEKSEGGEAAPVETAESPVVAEVGGKRRYRKLKGKPEAVKVEEGGEVKVKRGRGFKKKKDDANLAETPQSESDAATPVEPVSETASGKRKRNLRGQKGKQTVSPATTSIEEITETPVKEVVETERQTPVEATGNKRKRNLRNQLDTSVESPVITEVESKESPAVEALIKRKRGRTADAVEVEVEGEVGEAVVKRRKKSVGVEEVEEPTEPGVKKKRNFRGRAALEVETIEPATEAEPPLETVTPGKKKRGAKKENAEVSEAESTKVETEAQVEVVQGVKRKRNLRNQPDEESPVAVEIVPAKKKKVVKTPVESAMSTRRKRSLRNQEADKDVIEIDDETPQPSPANEKSVDDELVRAAMDASRLHEMEPQEAHQVPDCSEVIKAAEDFVQRETTRKEEMMLIQAAQESQSREVCISEEYKKPLNIVVDNTNVSVIKEAESTTCEDSEIPLKESSSDEDKQAEYSSKINQNQELKLTITKTKSDEPSSILKIYDPKNPQLNQISPSESETDNEELPIPKFMIKQSSPKVLSPLKITIKPVLKPEEMAMKGSPKLIIKPIIKPDDHVEERHHSPKITIKPIVKPDDADTSRCNSPKITIKPILKPTEASTSPKITIKPIVKPDDLKEEVEERIVLKINKNNIQQKSDESEKLGKIKLKFSKEGRHAHIINEDERPPAEEPENIPIAEVPDEAPHLDTSAVLIVEAEVNSPADSTLESSPAAAAPKKRGRPRKIPLVVREEFKDQRDVPSPLETSMEVDGGASQPAEEAKETPTGGRPKRSCRGPSVAMTLGLKPRKPRGSRGGRIGRGGGRVEKEPKRGRLSESKLKLIKEAAVTAKVSESLESQDVAMTIESSVSSLCPSPILIDDSSEEKEVVVKGAPVVVVVAEEEPFKPEEVVAVAAPVEEPVKVLEEVKEEEGAEEAVIMYEEETRMSADINNSMAQTPQKQISTVQDVVEESQSSVQSSTTTESAKAKKCSRLDVFREPDAITSPDQLAEYYWAGGGPYMLQEQVAQFLGIKSFKRKYPGIPRRTVDMQERDFIRDSNLASEHMCDLGLTAVSTADILDIMYSDFQNKYEEYCKHLRDRQTKDITNKQKALNLAASQEKNKLDLMQQAIESASQWNISFNKTRREERKACMDLQTFTINYPKGTVKQIQKPKIGSYPIALVPGQYTDYYETFTPTQLNNLPLNTMLYHPINSHEEDSQSDGSGSSSDSSSSESDSSDSESSDCTICNPGGGGSGGATPAKKAVL